MGSHASTRNGFLDSLRFVAAIGIVLFHLELPGGSIGLSALDFFVVILCYFAAQNRGSNGFEYQLNRLNQRIALPWMAWGAIYFLAKVVDAHQAGLPYSGEFETYMWWTGPSLHLWFLPFAFTMGLVITQLVAPIRISTPIYWALIMCIVLLCLVCGRGVKNDVVGAPWIQWLSVLPASGIGVCLAAAERRKDRMIALFVAIVLAGLVAYRLVYTSFALQLVIGGLAATFAVLWNPGGNRFTFWLGAVSMGIYLAHPLCFAIVKKITKQDSNWLTFILTVILAIAMAETYRRAETAIMHMLEKRQGSVDAQQT
jgi:peptidoglycan/LPS O-acetylase OafA/YrhL